MASFFGNYILMNAVIASLLAQVIKFFINLFILKKLNFERFFGTGGMPSSHTAMMCALTVSVAQVEGTASTAFAISFVISCVVIYDALNIRRAAGEQAKAINEIRAMDDNFEQLKELLGHTPLEVLGGMVLGICIPTIAYFI